MTPPSCTRNDKCLAHYEELMGNLNWNYFWDTNGSPFPCGFVCAFPKKFFSTFMYLYCREERKVMLGYIFEGWRPEPVFGKGQRPERSQGGDKTKLVYNYEKSNVWVFGSCVQFLFALKIRLTNQFRSVKIDADRFLK